MRNYRFVILSGALMALMCPLPVTGCTAVADFPDYPLLVESLALGDNFVCVISKNREALCWGNNISGQLGSERDSALDNPWPVDQLESVLEIALGKYHACAIADTDSVWCWGTNNVYQVGATVNDDFVHAQRVSGLPAMKQVFAGPQNSCAGGYNDEFFCWGINDALQLTKPMDLGYSATPVPIPPIGMNIKSLAVGERHICALDGEGDVYCWGDNSSGQTGLGMNHVDEEACERENRCIRIPHKVESLSNVERIASASTHTCALLGGGSIRCWGENFDGQAGVDNDSNLVFEPAEVMEAPVGSRWIRVDTGFDHSCAVEERGDLYCWGNNYWGQLGVDDELVERSWQPLRVVGLEDVREVALGNGTTCAIVGHEKTLYCWGNSTDGQISFDAESYSAPVEMGL